MSQMLELPDALYRDLLEEASANGTTPAGWIAEKLSKRRPAPTREEIEAANARLRQFTVAVDYGTGSDNESIDADLTRECGSRAEAV